MSLDLAASLRRVKPQRRIGPLHRRADSELPFLAAPAAAGPALLLDSTVYIDALQGRLPAEAAELLRIRPISHSAVAVAELAYLFGRLDPAHPQTRPALAAMRSAIEAIPSHRLAAPGLRTSVEAGMIAGLFARARGLARRDRLRVVADATLLLQALENGHSLLTRDVADFDPLQQLVPAASLLFYRRTP